MYEYDEECLKTFLRDQSKLFDEPVAETLEEAEAFLEDCMATVVESLDEVKEFLEEEGLDIDGMSMEELAEQIYAKQSLENLEYSSDSPYTAQIITDAIREALKKAETTK